MTIGEFLAGIKTETEPVPVYCTSPHPDGLAHGCGLDWKHVSDHECTVCGARWPQLPDVRPEGIVD